MDWSDYIESDCRKNYTYFDSADFLKNGYHLTSIFTIPLSAFTFYAIWRHTPRRMKNMRVPLVIFHIWSTNLDLIFTVLSEPMVFFPSASGLSLGVLGSIGVPVKWQTYWAQVSIMMMGVCFVMLYENRHSQITTIKFRIKTHRSRIIYFSVNYLLAFLLMLPFYLENSDQYELRQIVLKRISCPTVEFYSAGNYVILKGGETIPFLSISTCLSLIIIQTFFFLSHTIYHLKSGTSGMVSENTKSLQRKFLGYV